MNVPHAINFFFYHFNLIHLFSQIDVEKLKEETLNFVQILEFVTNSPLMSPALIKSNTNRVVDEMMEYARTLVEKTPECRKFGVEHKRTAIDLTLIIDGSRTAYDNLQFINSIAEMIDVSTFGSYISIIHGSTGRFLVNKTNSIPNLFEQLRNVSSVESKLNRKKNSEPAVHGLSQIYSTFLLQIPFGFHFQTHLGV